MGRPACPAPSDAVWPAGDGRIAEDICRSIALAGHAAVAGLTASLHDLRVGSPLPHRRGYRRVDDGAARFEIPARRPRRTRSGAGALAGVEAAIGRSGAFVGRLGALRDGAGAEAVGAGPPATLIIGKCVPRRERHRKRTCHEPEEKRGYPHLVSRLQRPPETTGTQAPCLPSGRMRSVAARAWNRPIRASASPLSTSRDRRRLPVAATPLGMAMI